MKKAPTARTLFVVAATSIAGCTVVSRDQQPPTSEYVQQAQPYRSEFPAQGPTYGTDQRYCDRSALSDVLNTSTSNIVGTAAGAAAGGLVGSQFGKGSGQTAMTIAGVLAGALAGGAIARTMDPVDHGCINEALEHTPPNQSIAWQNPNNHASYWVTPSGTTVGADGTPCRT